MLQSHLTVNQEISVCSVVIRISQAQFIRRASHLAGLLLKTSAEFGAYWMKLPILTILNKPRKPLWFHGSAERS